MVAQVSSDCFTQLLFLSPPTQGGYKAMPCPPPQRLLRSLKGRGNCVTLGVVRGHLPNLGFELWCEQHLCFLRVLLSSPGPCVGRNAKGRTQNKHKAKLCVGKLLQTDPCGPQVSSECWDEGHVGSSQGLWCLHDRLRSWDSRETCVPLSSIAELDEAWMRLC